MLQLISAAPLPPHLILQKGTAPPTLQCHKPITLPDNVLHLQEETSDAMVHLLTFRASVDAHWQRLISALEITHCQNEIKDSEAISGIEAHYVVALHDTEAIYGSAMREAEAAHLASNREAEATTGRVAEATRAAQTSKL